MELGRPPVSTSTFWEELYAGGDDGCGRFPARDATGPARVAVPGCGRGHDARLLARRGYHVWGFDFAPAAIALARDLAGREGVEVEYEERDIFMLDRDHA